MNISSVNCAENLALRPGVHITVSQPHPIGGGSRNPRTLLNETAHLLDNQPLANYDRSKSYDTYGGQNAESHLDWYMLEFPVPVEVNCIEMTMGFPHRDGGWWASLNVEVSTDCRNSWFSVDQLTITPPYRFDNTPINRRLFETYELTFTPMRVRALRLIGQPGGIAKLTSLARIAVYKRNLSRWNPLNIVTQPVPHIFRLIPPQVIFDLSENLAALTGLNVEIPLMEYYLDAQRFERYWHRVSRNYQGEPDLPFLLGESMGWNAWNRLLGGEVAQPSQLSIKPHVKTIFHHALACAVAPITVDGQSLGTLTAGYAIVKDHLNESWLQEKTQYLHISQDQYIAALKRTPYMTLRQLQATAELLGMISNTIANLAHRLEHSLTNEEQHSQNHKAIITRAIDYMESHIEEGISVARVAQNAGLTLPYFSSLFKQETGYHPSDYLITLRIERAKEYFTHTPLSVIDIASKFGYDPSYFSRLFKRRTGYAPSHYAMLARSPHH